MSEGGDSAVFSPKLLLGWIGVAALLFAGTIYALAGGWLPAGRQPGLWGPSSFSRSAIGYAGVAELLRRSGVAVVSSKHDALAQLGRASSSSPSRRSSRAT
jgi:hypothetical protein